MNDKYTEIKLRAWLPRHKQFVEYELGAEYDENDFKDAAFQRYTGLQTEDGTDIYEGDLLGSTFSNGLIHTNELVRFRNGCFMIFSSYNDYNDSGCLLCDNLHMPIIGNVNQGIYHELASPKMLSLFSAQEILL